MNINTYQFKTWISMIWLAVKIVIIIMIIWGSEKIMVLYQNF